MGRVEGIAMNHAKKRLKKSGWWETDSHLWHNPDMNPTYGGYTLQEAIKKQDMHIIILYGAYYYYIKDTFGFGYWIGHYKSISKNPSRTSFDHLNLEDAQALVSKLNSTKDYKPVEGVDYRRHKYNLICIFTEKHGRTVFAVPTKSDLEKVALHVVLKRHEEEMYYFSEEKPTKPKITVKRAIPLGIQQQAQQLWNEYESDLKEYKSSQEQKHLLGQVVMTKNSSLALQYLLNRRKYEYENFEIIEVEKLNETH